MPGGKYDSSKTRVRPVFDALWQSGRDWLPTLLRLPLHGCTDSDIVAGDLTLQSGYWEPNEKCLNPPVSLLSWLIRNAGGLSSEPSGDLRRRLAAGDAETVQEALRLLRTSNEARGWYIFEGPTCPDVLLIANDAIVVIEGKRTEKTTTTGTTWLTGRHQIWRHIDAAWEIRGRRAVYGFFIVENASDGSIPDGWRAATMACLDSIALHASFPHRSAEEVLAISRCYLGVTTWQDVCDCFSIDRRVLLDEVSSSG